MLETHDVGRAPAIPLSHRDLVERPLVARLTTSMPDGYPQTHPVWFTWEEPSVCINIMRGFRKERNMRADPRVAVLCSTRIDVLTGWRLMARSRLRKRELRHTSTSLPGCTRGGPLFRQCGAGGAARP